MIKYKSYVFCIRVPVKLMHGHNACITSYLRKENTYNNIPSYFPLSGIKCLKVKKLLLIYKKDLDMKFTLKQKQSFKKLWVCL